LVTALERRRRGEPEPVPAEAAADRDAPAPAPAPAEPPPLSDGAVALEARLRAAGHEPPSEAELGAAAAELPALREAGRAVRVGRAMHAHPDAIAGVRERVVAIVEAEGEITLARLRDELHTSRKYAQALLEHLDAARVTVRRPDDSRVLRRHAR
jgi:selenocysteine-specific elongation factor